MPNEETGEAAPGRPTFPSLRRIGEILDNEVRPLLEEILRRLDQRPAPSTRESYTVEEVAEMLGKSAYSVREWAREGRINASKRQERRGGAQLWAIAAREIQRYRDEGLLPPDIHRNAQH